MEPEDIYKTEEFKRLHFMKRFLIRIKIAFFETLKMF